MANAIRIKLNPVPSAVPNSNRGVSAVRVALVRHGQGSSLARVGVPQPAKITFYASQLKTAADPD